MNQLFRVFGVLAASILAVAMGLAGCSDDETIDTDPTGGGGGPGGGGPGEGICLLNNCSDTEHCLGCDDGRTTCLLAENRCVACDPNTGEGCPDGKECSPFGICVPEGLTCPTDGDGNPTVVCNANSDCLACSPMHQVCDQVTAKCQACIETNTQHCLQSDICADLDDDGRPESCSPKCPESCQDANDCLQCGPLDENGVPSTRACFQHKCSECSDTFPCASNEECVNGTCQAPCGILGAPPGTCEGDPDCASCGDGDDQWNCRTPINDPSHGICTPPATGCSDLGGFAVLPAPYDQVTNLCSVDADCANVGVQYNVGKAIRDLVGSNELDLGFTEIEIHDANFEYPMPECAELQVTDTIACSVCVPCDDDADCQPINVDPLVGDLFASDPLAQIAFALLADLLWGDADDHHLNFFCLELVAGYGACLPCGNPLQPCTTTAPPPGGMGCTHDTCTEGGALDADCDTCTTAVCNEDPYCCTTAWDDQCVDEADQYCGNICNGGVCALHDECAQGDALNSSCSACTADICAADAFCCDTYWDDVCVGHGTFGHPDFLTGTNCDLGGGAGVCG